jgi:4'-phosphopantetheinyl transferase
MADLDRVTDGFPAPLTLIDEGERQQAKRYRFDEDRRRFVARRAVLRELLGRHLGLHPSVVQIDRGPGAKPEVRGADAVYFNATASGSTALVAISGAEVGIDVERVADRTDLGLARRWLSARERSLHDRLDHRERERALFACLTKKEAVLKAAGVGLGIDPSLVSVPIDDATTPVEVPTLLPSLWWVRALTLPGRLVGALATADPEPTVNRFVLRELSSGRNALP